MKLILILLLFLEKTNKDLELNYWKILEEIFPIIFKICYELNLNLEFLIHFS